MSILGGPISRGEVIARARYWLTLGLKYNQQGSAPDSTGRRYRTDCSGLVCMAWHLNDGPDTDRLSRQFATEISGGDLRKGDILNYLVGPHSQHHVVLFQAWESATTFSYLSFGSTPMKEYRNATLARGDGRGSLSGHPVGGYRAYRYHNIVDGDGEVPVPSPQPIGEKLTVDGEFGPLTKSRLQRSLNNRGCQPPLDVDGIFGSKSTRALQWRLNQTHGRVDVDGVIGPQTISALQKRVGAPVVNGHWGRETTEALQSTLNHEDL